MQYPIAYPPFLNIAYGEGCKDGSFKSVASDCTVYGMCVNGRYKQFNCASGLHWNNNANSCDWPASAGCTPSLDNEAVIVEEEDDGGTANQPSPPVIKPQQVITTTTEQYPDTSGTSTDTGMKVVCCKYYEIIV